MFKIEKYTWILEEGLFLLNKNKQNVEKNT